MLRLMSLWSTAGSTRSSPGERDQVLLIQLLVGLVVLGCCCSDGSLRQRVLSLNRRVASLLLSHVQMVILLGWQSVQLLQLVGLVLV